MSIGIIRSYAPMNGIGVIHTDKNEYVFTRRDWHSQAGVPVPGMVVDFRPDGIRAKCVTLRVTAKDQDLKQIVLQLISRETKPANG